MKRSAGRCGLSTPTPFLRWTSPTVNSERHTEKEVGNGNSPPPTEAKEYEGLPPGAVSLSTGSQMANAADGFPGCLPANPLTKTKESACETQTVQLQSALRWKK